MNNNRLAMKSIKAFSITFMQHANERFLHDIQTWGWTNCLLNNYPVSLNTPDEVNNEATVFGLTSITLKWTSSGFRG